MYLEKLYELHIDRSAGSDACHPWTGPFTDKGYGQVSYHSYGTILAHRWGYEHFIGPLGPGEKVRHTCDNKPCQNQKHWLKGTHADNMQDMVERKRNPGNRKLTQAAVDEMRQLYTEGMSQKELSERYEVGNGSVSKIVNRKQWR